MNAFKATSLLLLTGVLLACAAAAPSTRPAGVSPAAAAGGAQDTLIPAGHGTLKQDEVTLSLRSGALLLKLTPLNEGVTRLLAPDTYNRLHGLAQNRRELVSSVRDPELFLVTFFSYQPDVTFQPQDVQLMHQGRLLRLAGVEAITPNWGRQHLDQQENQSAIYAFEGPIDFNQVMTLQYAGAENQSWGSLVPKLQAERNKVLSRASGTAK